MIKEFDMLQSKLEHIPLPPGIQLFSDMKSPPVDPNCFSRIVGKLIFLTTIRPDLAYVVSIVSGNMSSTSKKNLSTTLNSCVIGCPLRLGGDSRATARAFSAVQNDMYTTGVMM
jgi:hypothetical protein